MVERAGKGSQYTDPANPIPPQKGEPKEAGRKRETSILTHPKSFLFGPGKKGDNLGWEKKIKKMKKSKSGREVSASI